jgi:Uma2 family endonuclease
MEVTHMTTTQRKTFEDLMATPDDGYRYELVRGEILRMPPPKGEHPYIEAALVAAIGRYLHERAMSLGWDERQDMRVQHALAGRLMCGEGGIRVSIPTDPDQVRGIDVGYLTAEQAQRLGPIAPDEYTSEAPALIAEVVSPSERATYIEDKIADYFSAGAQLVWLLFPSRRTVRVCLPSGDTYSVPPEGVLDGSTVLPGFAVRVANLFPY